MLFTAFSRYNINYVKIKYNGATLLSRQTRNSLTMNEFEVDLISGNWPEEKDIITLCDGDDPKYPCHFGGQVYKISENKIRVLVFID